MDTKLAPFTEKVVTVAQKAVVGQPAPTVSKGEGGYADWVIISIHALREYLDQPYRRLMEILYEMPDGTVVHVVHVFCMRTDRDAYPSGWAYKLHYGMIEPDPPRTLDEGTHERYNADTPSDGARKASGRIDSRRDGKIVR